MHSKVLLRAPTPEINGQRFDGVEDRTPSHWSDGASLTVVLLLSLGVWAATWEAVASLASAVLQ